MGGAKTSVYTVLVSRVADKLNPSLRVTGRISQEGNSSHALWDNGKGNKWKVLGRRQDKKDKTCYVKKFRGLRIT